MPNNWLWQAPDWPLLQVDKAALAQPLATARLAQGRLLGKSEALGILVALPAAQLV